MFFDEFATTPSLRGGVFFVNLKLELTVFAHLTHINPVVSTPILSFD